MSLNLKANAPPYKDASAQPQDPTAQSGMAEPDPDAQPCPRISALLLRPVTRALAAANLDYEAFLSAEGLSPADLEVVDRRVPMQASLRIMAAGSRASGDPAFGLTVASHVGLQDIGLLGQLVMTARNVRDSAERLQRFGRLLCDSCRARSEERGGKYYWYLEMENAPMGATGWESIVGAVTSQLASRALPGWTPSEVWFPYPAPDHVDAYRRFFRCSLRFDMPTAALVLDTDVLALENPSDGAVGALIVRRAESALASLGNPTSFRERVRAQLAASLEHGEIGAHQLAAALHMSRATLGRRLSEEGTCVREVLDQLRRELAMEYMRDPSVSLDELASRLAFSDARALRRACVRWTGQTPKQLRGKTV